MIRSFADKTTEKLFNNIADRRFPSDILDHAHKKLAILHRARTLDDLRHVPANRLERLRGNREGQYSLRINDQWRRCFRWSDGSADDVEIVDYH